VVSKAYFHVLLENLAKMAQLLELRTKSLQSKLEAFPDIGDYLSIECIQVCCRHNL